MAKNGICSVCSGKTSRVQAVMCRGCRSAHLINIMKHPTKVRQREWHLKKKYGLDAGEFDAWWTVFKGKCGICSIEMTMPLPTQGQSLTAVCVDHDHVTGNIRGLLCNACNKALGLFKDDPQILINASKWVSK